jgi:hypothetical protein
VGTYTSNISTNILVVASSEPWLPLPPTVLVSERDDCFMVVVGVYLADIPRVFYSRLNDDVIMSKSRNICMVVVVAA